MLLAQDMQNIDPHERRYIETKLKDIFYTVYNKDWKMAHYFKNALMLIEKEENKEEVKKLKATFLHNLLMAPGEASNHSEKLIVERDPEWIEVSPRTGHVEVKR